MMLAEIAKLSFTEQEKFRMWINKKLSELPETDQEIVIAEGVDVEAERIN